MEIIHLHILHIQKRGLAKYHSSIRVLCHYLAFHSQLRPTSKTLFCILQTLRCTKKAGTISQRLLDSFEQRWGPEAIDHQVRRRLASLALKEGRVDIAQAQVAHQSRPEIKRNSRLSNSGPTKTRFPKLPRIRFIYLGRNKEVQRWKLLYRKVWRRTRPTLLLNRQSPSWQYQTQIAKVLIGRMGSHRVRSYSSIIHQ